MYTKESFDVYQKYQSVVHKKPEKSRVAYENFLCQSPLFDPTLADPEDKFGPFDEHIDD